MYAHNDRIAPGAYQAAKKVGREKEMIFVGIDALPGKGNGLEMVLDSVLNATFYLSDQWRQSDATGNEYP